MTSITATARDSRSRAVVGRAFDEPAQKSALGLARRHLPVPPLQNWPVVGDDQCCRYDAGTNSCFVGDLWRGGRQPYWLYRPGHHHLVRYQFADHRRIDGVRQERELDFSSNIGIDLYVGRTVFKIAITFGHHLILYFIGVGLMIVPFGWTSLLAIPGIILLFVNGFWIVTVLAFICARFRDVELIVRNLLQLAFFVTPVFWNHQNIAGNRRFIVDYNVIFYFIEIIRAPLLGQVPPLHDYLVVAGVTIFGFVLAFAVYRHMRRQLAFFV